MVARRSVPFGRPGDRNRRIELVAAIAFGHEAQDPNRAVRGWQTRLSRAMGMGRTAVSDTLVASGSGSVFDRKLQAYVAGLRLQLAEDMETLKQIEAIAGASDNQVFGYTDAWAEPPER